MKWTLPNYNLSCLSGNIWAETALLEINEVGWIFQNYNPYRLFREISRLGWNFFAGTINLKWILPNYNLSRLAGKYPSLNGSWKSIRSGRFSEIIILTVRLGKPFNLEYNALLFLMSISFFAIWRMKFGKIDLKKIWYWELEKEFEFVYGLGLGLGLIPNQVKVVVDSLAVIVNLFNQSFIGWFFTHILHSLC